MAPGRRCVLEVVHLAQSEHEGEHAVLVVEQDVADLAAGHAAERQRRPGGEAERVDGRDGVGAEGHDVGVVAHLDALFHQLMDDAAAVHVAREEHEDVALLQLAHDRHRRLVAAGGADDGGEAGHAAVHQLDAPGAQLDVVDGPVRVASGAAAVAVGMVARAREAQAGDALRLLAADEAYGFDGFGGKESGGAAVQSLAQVREPQAVAGRLAEQPAGLGERLLQLPQVVHLHPGETQDHRQVVGGIRERDRLVGTKFGDGRFAASARPRSR